MEAWEHIAPELPPGWERQGGVCVNGTTGRHITLGDSYKRNAELCWEAWEHKSGITRKRYAELIAVERVREVAAKWWGDELDICVAISTQAVAIAVGRPEPGRPSPIEVAGPTLFDAAWACIHALGGGE